VGPSDHHRGCDNGADTGQLHQFGRGVIDEAGDVGAVDGQVRGERLDPSGEADRLGPAGAPSQVLLTLSPADDRVQLRGLELRSAATVSI